MEGLSSELHKKIVDIKTMIHHAIEDKEYCTGKANNPLTYQENFSDTYVVDENKPIESGMECMIDEQKRLLENLRTKKQKFMQEFFEKIKIKTNEIASINAILQFSTRWQQNVSVGKTLEEYPESFYKCLNSIQDEETKAALFKMMNEIKPVEKEKLNTFDVTPVMSKNSANKTMPVCTTTPGISLKSKIPQSCYINVNTRKTTNEIPIISPVKCSDDSTNKMVKNESYSTPFSVLEFTQRSNVEQNSTNKSVERLSVLCSSVSDEAGVDNSYNLSQSMISRTIHNLNKTQDMVLSSPSKTQTPGHLYNTQYSTLNFTQDTLQINEFDAMNSNSKDNLNGSSSMSIVDSDKEEDDILNQPIQEISVSDEDKKETSNVNHDKQVFKEPSCITDKSYLNHSILMTTMQDQSLNHDEYSGYWPENMPMDMRNKSTCPPIEKPTSNLDDIIREEDEFRPNETSIFERNTSIYNRSIQPNQPENSRIEDSIINFSHIEHSMDMESSRPLLNVSDMPSGIQDMSQLDADFGAE